MAREAQNKSRDISVRTSKVLSEGKKPGERKREAQQPNLLPAKKGRKGQ